MEKVGGVAHRATMEFPKRNGGYYSKRGRNGLMSVYDVLSEPWCKSTGHDLTAYLVHAKILAADEADNIGIRVVLAPRTLYHDDLQFTLSLQNSGATASFTGTLDQVKNGKLITRTAKSSKWLTALKKMTAHATHGVAHSSSASGNERILATAMLTTNEGLEGLQHRVEALQHQSEFQQSQITKSDAKIQALQQKSEVQQGEISKVYVGVWSLEQKLKEWNGG